jgi:hypothetical protein
MRSPVQVRVGALNCDSWFSFCRHPFFLLRPRWDDSENELLLPSSSINPCGLAIQALVPTYSTQGQATIVCTRHPLSTCGVSAQCKSPQGAFIQNFGHRSAFQAPFFLPRPLRDEREDDLFFLSSIGYMVRVNHWEPDNMKPESTFNALAKNSTGPGPRALQNPTRCLHSKVCTPATIDPQSLNANGRVRSCLITRGI